MQRPPPIASRNVPVCLPRCGESLILRHGDKRAEQRLKACNPFEQCCGYSFRRQQALVNRIGCFQHRHPGNIHIAPVRSGHTPQLGPATPTQRASPSATTPAVAASSPTHPPPPPPPPPP